MVLQQVVILKHAVDQRVGISFVAEEDDGAGYGALVSRLSPEGLAARAGLRKGDRVLQIEGASVSSAPNAAATMRGSVGEIIVTVERGPDFLADGYGQYEAASEDAAGDALKKLRGWFAEATTPRGTNRAPGLLAAMGQGLARFMAPKAEHEAATQIGAHWRGFRTRALCYVWHWAAREIQRTVRGQLVRGFVLPALREREAVERAQKAAEAARVAEELSKVAEQAARQEAYLRECRATEEFLQSEAEAQTSARSSGAGKIKKALSFGSKKKRRPPLAADPPTNGDREPGTPKPDSGRSNSSGPVTPPPASPRLQYTPPKAAPHTAPAKKSVRRTLSWTRRTSRHIEAGAKKQIEAMI